MITLWFNHLIFLNKRQSLKELMKPPMVARRWSHVDGRTSMVARRWSHVDGRTSEYELAFTLMQA
jgi:hypothetical protein